MNFKLASDYDPRGDQPQAISQLVRGVNDGDRHQVLLGVTGSGKTFTDREGHRGNESPHHRPRAQ